MTDVSKSEPEGEDLDENEKMIEKIEPKDNEMASVNMNQPQDQVEHPLGQVFIIRIFLLFLVLCVVGSFIQSRRWDNIFETSI